MIRTSPKDSTPIIHRTTRVRDTVGLAALRLPMPEPIEHALLAFVLVEDGE